MANTHDVVIIGGFGHVGLPLGIVLADSGFRVGLHDIDMSKREGILHGEMPFIEEGAEPLLKKVIGKQLNIVESLEELSSAKYVIITIGTPVDEYLSPHVRSLFDLTETLRPHLRPEQCVILRSTVFPGTTRSLLETLKQKGCNVHMCYCPERIVQGFAVKELRTLPQIISGFEPEGLKAATVLFEKIGAEAVVTEVEEAELIKLYLNAWRYIRFAVGNQFYMMATERGLDYERIYHAMTHDYPRGKDLPGPGFAAGPCLLKDTMQLAASHRSGFLLGHAAMMVNEGLPAFIVDQLAKEMPLRGKRVGILGMAFKADNDDHRDSLSYKLRKLLRIHGAETICSDEFIKDPSFVSKEDLIAKSDIIIVGVPHTAYKSVSVPGKTRTVDVWNVLPDSSA